MIHRPIVLMIVLLAALVSSGGMLIAAEIDQPMLPEPAVAPATVAQAAEQTPHCNAFPPTLESTLGSTLDQTLRMALRQTVIEADPADPKPVSYCNCNPETAEANCKRICGERGGSCLVTIACNDPNWVGWCHCNT